MSCPLLGECGSLHSVKVVQSATTPVGRSLCSLTLLTAFSLFGSPSQAFFPFTAFTKCALIYHQKWYVRPTGFLQNSNLSKHRQMCSHSLRSLGYISRLLGSILRPLFQAQISRQPVICSAIYNLVFQPRTYIATQNRENKTEKCCKASIYKGF